MGNCIAIAMQEKNGKLQRIGETKTKKKVLVFGEEGVAMRIKVIISKKELREILEREGVSMDDVAVRRVGSCGMIRSGVDGADSRGSWIPVLESIPEL